MPPSASQPRVTHKPSSKHGRGRGAPATAASRGRRRPCPPPRRTAPEASQSPGGSPAGRGADARCLPHGREAIRPPSVRARFAQALKPPPAGRGQPRPRGAPTGATAPSRNGRRGEKGRRVCRRPPARQLARLRAAKGTGAPGRRPRQEQPLLPLPAGAASPSLAPSRSPQPQRRRTRGPRSSYLPPLPGRRRTRSCSPQIAAPASAAPGGSLTGPAPSRALPNRDAQSPPLDQWRSSPALERANRRGSRYTNSKESPPSAFLRLRERVPFGESRGASGGGSI